MKKKKLIKVVEDEHVSEIMVELAQYIDVEEWDVVLERLLKISELSFLKGYLTAIEVTKK